MSPEQVEQRDADTRSDIWALGARLYEMATRQRPFEGESTTAMEPPSQVLTPNAKPVAVV